MPERRKVAAKVAAWVAIVAYAAIAAAPARAGTDLTDKAVCSRTPAAARARDRLGEVMLHGRFVAYQPTSLHMVNGHPTRAEVASIRADLQVLRPYFDGLITYSSVDGAEAIPAIAASAGFRAVIIGVWNPFDPVQMQAALATAGEHPDIVIGLSLGNELVFAKRSSFADLAALTVSVRRRLPSIAVSTTEPFHMFREAAAPELLRQLDFMLVNVHPVFQPWFRDAPDRNAAEFVVNVVKQLPEGYCGPILVKEVGEPSAPSEAGFTPDRQASFFTELLTQFPRARERSFAYFSAFDAPWRAFDEIALPNKVSAAQTHPAEAHWGLFDERRRPKPVVARIPLLGSTPR